MYFNEKITMSEDENIDVGLATKATPKTKKPKIKYKKMVSFRIIIYSWVSDFFSYDDTIINEVVLRFKMF